MSMAYNVCVKLIIMPSSLVLIYQEEYDCITQVGGSYLLYCQRCGESIMLCEEDVLESW